MQMRRHRTRTWAWLSAVAAIPLLVLAVSAPLTAMRCRFTGFFVAACCCPEAGAGPEAPVSVQAQDCCTLEQIQAARPPSEPPPSGARLAVPIAAVAAIEPLDLDSLAPDLSFVHERDGTLPRPPLLLVKRSLLI